MHVNGNGNGPRKFITPIAPNHLVFRVRKIPFSVTGRTLHLTTRGLPMAAGFIIEHSCSVTGRGTWFIVGVTRVERLDAGRLMREVSTRITTCSRGIVGRDVSPDRGPTRVGRRHEVVTHVGARLHRERLGGGG